MKQTSHQAPAIAAVPANILQLKILVVICGAVLMALEIIGSRVISPYFGHSIYVWGSIISIFLGALSLGYYIGGRVADRFPSLRLLCSIIAVSGLTMLVLRYIAPWVCTSVYDAHLGPKWGTLAACLILFFIPSVLLGTVSPFSVRLATLSVANVGKTAGLLYALSTLGSIVGTLITSFVLIDTMGTNTVVLSLGVTLIVAAVGAGALTLRPSAPAVVSALLLPIAFFVPPPKHLGIIGKEETIIYETDSPYQHIIVSEGKSKNELMRRNLQFDRYIESAIYLPQPGEPTTSIRAATGYTDMMHLPVVFNPDFRTVLQIGGGGGTVPREYHDHYGFDEHGNPVDGFSVQIAEIDPKVVEMAEKFFYFRPGPRLTVTVDDGRMFLKNSQQKYDVILVDAFSGGGQIPFHLTTKEFFTEIKNHLTPNGVVAMNVISALAGDRGRLYLAILRTWQQTGFGQIYVFPKYDSWIKPPLLREMSRNVILVATMSPRRLSKADIELGALGLYQDGVIKIDKVVEHAKHYLPGEESIDFTSDPVLRKIPVLTDNYAPVELMAEE